MTMRSADRGRLRFALVAATGTATVAVLAAVGAGAAAPVAWVAAAAVGLTITTSGYGLAAIAVWIAVLGIAWAAGFTAVELCLIPLAGLVTAMGSILRRYQSHRRRRAATTVRLTAAAAERARLARDMHDSLSKTLDALALGVAALPTTLDEPARARRLAQTLQDATQHAAHESRKLIGDLRAAVPGLLDRDTLTSLAGHWSSETGIAVAVTAEPVDVGDDSAYELMWIVREALRNVAVHADARRAVIAIGPAANGSGATVSISDDGHGFDVPASLTPLQKAGHMGLVGMTERASVVGGALEIVSSPAGTRVTATVPNSPQPGAAPRLGAILAVAMAVAVLIAAVVVLAPRPHRRPDATGPQPSIAVTSGSTPSAASTPAAPHSSPSGSTHPSQGVPLSTSPGRLTPSTSGGAIAGATGTHPAAAGRPSAEARSCSVEYVLVDQWNPGFIADLHITNRTSVALSDWTLRFALPGDQQLISSWSNISTHQAGRTVSITGTDNHTTLPAGSTITVSIQGTWSASDAAPTAFTLDGKSCLAHT